jgi:hypothetical protein
MLTEPAAAAKVSAYKMAKIIIHENSNISSVNESRLFEDFKLSHTQRMEKAFKLMRLSLLFSKENKTDFKKGIILKNL